MLLTENLKCRMNTNKKVSLTEILNELVKTRGFS